MRGIERLDSVRRSTPAMAKALPDLPMAETVMVRLIRISVVGLGQFFEPVFREIGLSENSFHVLCLLMASDRNRASPSTLSEMVGTSRANMTRILDELESDGLVSRASGPGVLHEGEGDGWGARAREARAGRRYVIEITAAGRRAAQGAVPKLSQ